jgi:hypothetical protein
MDLNLYYAQKSYFKIIKKKKLFWIIFLGKIILAYFYHKLFVKGIF